MNYIVLLLRWVSRSKTIVFCILTKENKQKKKNTVSQHNLIHSICTELQLHFNTDHMKTKKCNQTLTLNPIHSLYNVEKP